MATRVTKTQRLEAGLRRIEAETRGYDRLSRTGWVNILARDALGMPISPDEKADLELVNRARAERIAREAEKGAAS